MLLELLSLSHTADDLRARNRHIDQAAALSVGIAQMKAPSRFARLNPFSRSCQLAAETQPASMLPSSNLVTDTAATARDTDAAAIAACLAA